MFFKSILSLSKITFKVIPNFFLSSILINYELLQLLDDSQDYESANSLRLLLKNDQRRDCVVKGTLNQPFYF